MTAFSRRTPSPTRAHRHRRGARSRHRIGLPIGHWRHTESTGSYKKTTYFDGRFRPLLTPEEDTANAASKRYTTRAFDHDNRETFSSYPEASATSTTSLTQGTHTTYDALGRVTSTSQNDGPSAFVTTSTAYLSGFQTRTSNPRGQVTTVSYQAYDSPDTSAPVSIAGPDGVSTTIVRDGFGMPLSVTRSGLYDGLPVSATRRYVYDGFERLCKRIDPEAGGTLFAYDGAGNLIASAGGQSSSLSCDAIPAADRISRSYDLRDRLLSVVAPNAPATLYGYAADGALTTLTQGDSAWSYSYNNRRLLTSETLSFGDTYAFTYSYNALGHLAASSTPSGLSIDTAPNALGQPSKAGTFASGAQYFPDGSLKQFTYGNGLVHSVTQNARHLPLQVRDALGAQVVHDFTYGYDQNGNVTTITDQDQAGLQSKSLLYDARDRLTSATATQLWGVASYSYDPLDNLRVADQGSRQYRYQYDANNRLTQLTDPTGAALPGLDFAYDGQGRQIRKGTQTRTFDGANRITAINGETYAYDGAGRRIATWASDGRTKVEVYTQSGQLGFAVDSAKGGGSSFIYLAGQRIAEDHWDCGTDTHTVSYYHADALGSPVATTDAARNILERTYYAPYGEALNRTVDGPGYTGHVMDAATGLVYAQQRYYDPLVGKFLSIDPVAADPNSGGNFNRYWYANDNPYKFTDPDGREGFGTNFVPDGGCNATGTCVSLEQAEKNFQGEGVKVVGVALVGPALIGTAVVAVPVVAAVAKPLLTKKAAKLVVCGVLSLCGKEKGGEVADDFERVEKIATRVLEKLRKAESKIEPPKPKIKPPPEPKPMPRVEPEKPS
ncbi:MAG: RHS repeat-associated core domain-containing protein [Pseudomonas sp.]|nr:RHS repeat-associated core domain-containing protein [Pseudomonas sp.]